MALNKSALKDRILGELTAQGFDVATNGRDNGNWLPKLAQAIANSVVDEITSNGEAVGQDSRGDSHDLQIR